MLLRLQFAQRCGSSLCVQSVRAYSDRGSSLAVNITPCMSTEARVDKNHRGRLIEVQAGKELSPTHVAIQIAPRDKGDVCGLPVHHLSNIKLPVAILIVVECRCCFLSQRLCRAVHSCRLLRMIKVHLDRNCHSLPVSSLHCPFFVSADQHDRCHNKRRLCWGWPLLAMHTARWRSSHMRSTHRHSAHSAHSTHGHSTHCHSTHCTHRHSAHLPHLHWPRHSVAPRSCLCIQTKRTIRLLAAWICSSIHDHECQGREQVTAELC